jgi:hypothetical protein
MSTIAREGRMAPRSVQYRGNIWILESSVAYRREVERYLNLIRTTRAGRILTDLIGNHRRWTLIMPFKPTAKDPVNAYAYAKTYADSLAKDYVATKPFTLPGGFVIQLPTAIGTGQGSMVYIDYHPATYRQVIKNKGYIAPGDGPGEVLFHQMTHGYRMLTGVARNDPVAGHERMDDIEEFYAILTANVYRSERGFHLLRKDHWGHEKLSRGLSYPEAYYDEYKLQIDNWFAKQRAFCLQMAHVSANFNPFRVAAIKLGLMQGPLVSMRLPT